MVEARRSEPGKVTRKLRQLYQQAGAAGLFIREFRAPNGVIAAVGEQSKLEELGVKDPSELEGAVAYISAPGFGKTRAKAVQAAIDSWGQLKNASPPE